MRQLIGSILIGSICWACAPEKQSTPLEIKVYQTSAAGDQLKELPLAEKKGAIAGDTIELFPEEQFQEISGFGGAFTESTTYLLNQLSPEKRREVLEAYFDSTGAAYSLCRTHINSCDFSLEHYSYAEVADDTLLEHFSIKHDRKDVIPVIKEAQAISKEGFNIIASPWTAPPWMKDNQDWNGGKLLEKYYPTWALFFEKYIKAYEQEGIPIWGLTVENEPLGNDANWESMHYTPEEMAVFVKEHLGPQLRENGLEQHILVYDQNRGKELEEWAEVLLKDEEAKKYIYGTAVHWYTSTVDWMPASLNFTHELAPDKSIIHTEGCVDAEVPHWKEDAWYWSKEATDWGWDWAPEEDKPDHPKYVPVYRYARDMIGCLNSWVEGWVDWNMVLDRQGGPNLAKNWCIAPVIVDTAADEVYYTPLYYTMAHFSKFIRPQAKRIGFQQSDSSLMVTAVQNTDGSLVVVLLNMDKEAKSITLALGDQRRTFEIAAEALQTIIL